jgi:hypothetical protein
MSDVVISVEGLGKKYRISQQAGRQRYTALRGAIAEKAKGLFKKLKFGNQKTENEGQQKTESRKQKSENAEGSNKFQLSKFPISNFRFARFGRFFGFACRLISVFCFPYFCFCMWRVCWKWERVLSPIDGTNGINHLVNMDVVATQVEIGSIISP